LQLVSSLLLDPTCVLLPPRRARNTNIPPTTYTSILKALATRFDVTLSIVRRHVGADHIEQWGKVRRIDGDGGDTMVASALATKQRDSRDATFVRVRIFWSAQVFEFVLNLDLV
jgi:hypothetical protein